MREYSAIYVPTKDRNGNPVNNENRKFWLDLLKRAFTKLFGGYTIVNGEGGWYDENRDIYIEEDVSVIYAHCSNNPDGRAELRDLAYRMLVGLKQASVLVVVDSFAEFIDASYQRTFEARQ